MKLVLSPPAEKMLAKMPTRDAEAMRRKLKAFALDPFGKHMWAKGLTGGGVRVRHGDWRAICDVDGKALIVLVVKIGNRREIYR